MSSAAVGPTPGALNERTHTKLCMVGGPYVLRGDLRLAVPEGSKRLLVFVALHGGLVDRRHVAGTLWPNGDDERASGNLRSALWRLKGAGIDVLQADKSSIYLCPDTEVDVTSVREWAARVIEGNVRPSDLQVSSTTLEAVHLLPGWYDDWVIFERERLRQRLLHALEALSRQLVQMERWSEAVEVAMTAVNMEPLRESAQRMLAEAHMAEGNLVEAHRCFVEYRGVLRAELDAEPSREFALLVKRGCGTTRGSGVVHNQLLNLPAAVGEGARPGTIH